MKTNISPRFTYAFLSFALIVTEVLIALFIHDEFIRPYGGDIIVTALLCCMARAVFLKKIPFIPLFVFIFSVFVEISQYFKLVELIGLGDIRFFRILMGTSFSFVDILCYGAGCVLFWIVERLIAKLRK